MLPAFAQALESQTTNKQSKTTCQQAKTGNPCLGLGGTPSLNLGIGNPIHLVSGNKYQQEDDLLMRASGIEFVRYYNSLHSNRASMLGAGWRHSYNRHLYIQNDHTKPSGYRVQIELDDGSRLAFGELNQQGQALALNPAYGYLVKKQNNQWLWITPAGITDTFNQAGYLIASKAPNLYTLTIKREQKPGPTYNEISKVVSSQGESLVFHYEIFHQTARLSRVDSPVGTYFFSHQRATSRTKQQATIPQLVKVQRPDQWQFLYHYDAALQTPNNPNLLTGLSYVAPSQQSAIRTNSWHYNRFKQVQQSVMHKPQQYNPLSLNIKYLKTPLVEDDNGITQVSQSNGKITFLHSTIKGGQYLLTHVSGDECPGCAPSGTTANYDQMGRLIQLNRTFIEHNLQGQINQLTMPVGQWGNIQLVYGNLGLPIRWHSNDTGGTSLQYAQEPTRLLRKTAANGNIQSYEYHQDGIIKSVSSGRIGQIPDHIVQFERIKPQHIRLSNTHETQDIYYQKSDNTVHYKTQRHWADNSKTELREAFKVDYASYTVNHSLPEGGRLIYQYGSNNEVLSIRWQPQAATATHSVFLQLSPQLWLYGNGFLRHSSYSQVSDPNTNFQHLAKNTKFYTSKGSSAIQSIQKIIRLYAPGNTKNAIWQQTQHFRQNGLLSREQTHSLNNDFIQDRYLTYDQFNRMESLHSYDGKLKHRQVQGFDWRDNGQNQRQFKNSNLFELKIKNDTASLPQQYRQFNLIYNSRQLLHTLTDHNNSSTYYQYNGLGLRISKVTQQGETQYYYLDHQLVAESFKSKIKTNSKNQHLITKRYIYSGLTPVAMIDYTDNPQGILYFVHTDAVGQAILITDTQQRNRWQARHTVFGQAELIKGDIEFNLRLPGQYFDKESGLHQNIYRNYDPAFGHYLEPDPLGPTDHTSPYGYAQQKPRQLIDPRGLVMFVFDGTTNNPARATNAYKLMQLYKGKTHYVTGSGTKEIAEYVKTADYSSSDHYMGELLGQRLVRKQEWPITNSYKGATMDMLVANATPFILNYQWFKFIEEIQSLPRASAEHTIPITITGFSRGAAYAMIFAKRIAHYTNNGLFTYSPPWHKGPPIQACLDLRFVGIFDMVSQLGPLGFENNFYDYTVSPAWSSIAHAVAINEYRELFTLTSYANSGFSNVVEEGFLGAHSDVGGATFASDPYSRLNPNPGTYSDLSNIALAWVYDQAINAGVDLAPLSSAKAWQLDQVNNPLIHLPGVLGANQAWHEKRPKDDRAVQDQKSNTLYKQSYDPKIGAELRNYYLPYIGPNLQTITVDDMDKNNPSWNNPDLLNPDLPDKSQLPFAMVDVAGYLKALEKRIGWKARLRYNPELDITTLPTLTQPTPVTKLPQSQKSP